VRAIGHQVDDPTSLGRAMDELLATRTEPPAVIALGEPTHGIESFPLLRNELLSHLSNRGYRSIALETDVLAASIVNDHVTGAPTDTDTVLATGFSHGFGALPSNRDLVEQLREHNAGKPPQDQIHFHGFDAPTEYACAPSPRRSLQAVTDYLPPPLRPQSTRDLEEQLGKESDWTNPAAMYDPTASIGNTDRAQALSTTADDLARVLHQEAEALGATDPTAYDKALAHARTAQGLLRYHAAMATDTPNRTATLITIRADMMADNLQAILTQEQHRGPTLLFAHNAHLNPHNDQSAAARIHPTLRNRYLFIATDANPNPEPGTLQSELAKATTTNRTLFPTRELQATLPPTPAKGKPIVPGHIPLTKRDLKGTEAMIFITTEPQRHQYW
jgi:erythromycin esterase-like protein